MFQFLQVFKRSCVTRLFTFSSSSQRPQRSNENHVDNLTALSMSSSSARWASPCPPKGIEPFQRSPPTMILWSTTKPYFSLLNEIGYFAIKFRHKASHLIFVALGNKFCRFPDVMPSLSDVLFICNLFYRSSRPSTTILANKFPKRVPAPEYVGGGEAEFAGDVVQR